MDINGYRNLIGYLNSANIGGKYTIDVNGYWGGGGGGGGVDYYRSQWLSANVWITNILQKWTEKYAVEVNGYQQLFGYQHSLIYIYTVYSVCSRSWFGITV